MKILLIVILIPALLIGAYMLTYPTHKYRQKLTLAVETPDGVKTATSVFRVELSREPTLGFPEAIGYRKKLYGQATIVDLGGGRYLFALMKDLESLPLRIMPDNKQRTVYSVRFLLENYKVVKKLKGVVPVPLDSAPYLVTFDDIRNPLTLQTVDPADLAATFGEGYALREITLENTKDALTTETIAKGLAKTIEAMNVAMPVRRRPRENDTFQLRPWHVFNEPWVKP